MAVTSARSTIRIDDTATHLIHRTWDVTAAVQDTAAGFSVVITTVQSSGGATPPVVPDLLELSVRIDNGATIITTFTLTPGSSSQTSTFFFTDTGLTGGSSRAGLVRMRLRARNNTDVNAANRYDATTDNGAYGSAANTYPTGFGLGASDRQGYLRGTTTATTTLPSSGLLAHPDTLTATTVLGAAPFQSQTVTVALNPTLAAVTSAASTTVTFLTAHGIVDERFPAAATSETSATAFPNAALLATPWTTASLTETTRSVDPRLTSDLHFQVDDDVFGLSKHVSGQTLLNTQSGFLWPKLTNARAEGVNGLTVSHTLDPVNPGTAITTSGSTSTQDGQAGVGSRLDWTAAKPGGRWDWTADVTAPSTIDADTHLIQSGDFTTMLVVDPRLKPIISLSPTVAIEARHLEPGDSMKMSVTVRNSETRKRVAQDTAPTAIVERYDRVAGWQYLASDGVTWTAWGTSAADVHTLVQEADTLSYAFTFSSTSGWTTTDIVGIDVTCLVENTPYPEYVQRELVSDKNRHDGYRFDALSVVFGGQK